MAVNKDLDCKEKFTSSQLDGEKSPEVVVKSTSPPFSTDTSCFLLSLVMERIFGVIHKQERLCSEPLITHNDTVSFKGTR